MPFSLPYSAIKKSTYHIYMQLVTFPGILSLLGVKACLEDLAQHIPAAAPHTEA